MDDFLYVVPLRVNAWGGTVWLEDSRLQITLPETEAPFCELPFCVFWSVHQPFLLSVCCLSIDPPVDDVIRL